MVTERKATPSENISIRDSLAEIRRSATFAKKGHKKGYKKDSKEPPFKAYGSKEELDRITKTVEVLAKSKTGLSLLKTAHDNGYSISLKKIGDGLGYCNPNQKTVVLNQNCTDDQNIGTLAHELTHANQFINGMGCADDMDMKSFFMETRIMEADAESRAGLALIELREQGIEKPWKCFTNDSRTVAQGLEKAYKKEGIKTKKARDAVLMGAFKGWYDNNLIKNAYDKDNLDFLKETLENNETVSLTEKITPKEFVEQCCQLEDGSNYFKGNPDILSQPKYLGVTESTMKNLKDFMKKREALQGLPYDKSLDEIPVVKSKGVDGPRKISITQKIAVQHYLSKNLKRN